MAGGGGGWPAGSNETKANSAQFGLNLGLAGLSLAKSCHSTDSLTSK